MPTRNIIPTTRHTMQATIQLHLRSHLDQNIMVANNRPMMSLMSTTTWPRPRNRPTVTIPTRVSQFLTILPQGGRGHSGIHICHSGVGSLILFGIAEELSLGLAALVPVSAPVPPAEVPALVTGHCVWCAWPF